jgi:uncharacterized protein (TIGR02246 family)
MRLAVIVALVACGVCLCQHAATAQPAAPTAPAAPAAPPAAAPEISAVMHAYAEAFQAKDIEGVMKTFADDPATIMMGTGDGETWVGKESIRAAHNAFFASIKKETTERKLLSAKQTGDTAWLAGFMTAKQTNEAGDNEFQLNLSLVLEKQGGEWRIVCMHFSRFLLLDKKP